MSVFVRLCEKNIFSTIKKTTPLCATYVAESRAPRVDGRKDSGMFPICFHLLKINLLFISLNKRFPTTKVIINYNGAFNRSNKINHWIIKIP